MPTLETARLILRPFTPADLDDYHAQIYSDPDVTRYLPGGQPRPKDRTQVVLEFAIEHGQQHGFTLWAVIDKASQEFIGHCGLIYMKNEVDVEVAYAFGKAHWGKGYAPEAAHAALRYGFETVGLDQIIAVAVPENTASQRVMQKIGMTSQGITDRYYDTRLALYTLDRADFNPGDSPYHLFDDQTR
jgi:RimJ/RimL family protein N-acetyltransferase